MTKTPRLTKQDWLRAGFIALVERGPSGLKAEPLARQLKTTKGSFYWHFRDVSQYRGAMLAYWQQSAFSNIVEHLEREPSVPKRLRLLGQIATGAAWQGYNGAPIEPAIRAWSRSDAQVAQVVLQIDEHRLRYLETMLTEIGISNPEFARLIYAGLIGLEDLSSRDGQAHAGPMGTLIDLILTLE
ncbi:MAG: TetR/AcrR family transcriptional regulator [Rhodobacteraceae bacterium]|nr:TetR/AcrR family transcriptional regulator [Paracoccaceae bacterium]